MQHQALGFCCLTMERFSTCSHAPPFHSAAYPAYLAQEVTFFIISYILLLIPSQSLPCCESLCPILLHTQPLAESTVGPPIGAVCLIIPAAQFLSFFFSLNTICPRTTPKRHLKYRITAPILGSIVY